LGFLVDDVMIVVCFAVILITSSIDPMSRFCGSNFYVQTTLTGHPHLCSTIP